MGMRGSDAASGALFSYVDMEARVPATHPLRTIRTIVNEVLTALDTEFEALYEGIGRQSVAPDETHASTTDPDARLYRKGSSQAAKLSYMGHALMENRHGLVVGATLTPATGTAEREAAIKMIVRRSPGARRLTLGADKGYDTKNFVADLRELNIAPHVAQNTTNRASAIDGRTTRHPGYAVSQIIRKRIEESFAWTKTIAGLHKTKHRGVGRVAFQFVFAMAAYNLIRMPRLLSTAA